MGAGKGGSSSLMGVSPHSVAMLRGGSPYGQSFDMIDTCVQLMQGGEGEC